jgi:hypothetical protein
MEARIVYQDAQGREGTVELGDKPTYLGRGKECAIRSADAMVSRKHAVIRFDDGHHVIEDLASSNGIEVNGKTVEKHILSHNDAIRCGSLWLRYVEGPPLGQEATSKTAAPPMGPVPTVAPTRGPSAGFDSARTLILPGRKQRQVMVPDVAEVQRLRQYIEELLRQVMELREQLDQARTEQARMAAELEKLRNG